MLPAIHQQPLLAPWRHVLEERARQAIDALKQVPGVLGLILAGSVGRGEAWPLSDVDMIPIYEDEHAAQARSDVEAVRLMLLDWWIVEGYPTSVDIGKLAFTRGEVLQALRLSPREATRYLDDLRWFHSLDKAYRSRAAFDPQGLAALLADWFTQARFAPEVVQGRAHIHWRQTVERYDQAAAALRKDDIPTAAIMFRESLHVLTRYLMEQWGGRDNSWARFGTRFERMATEQNEGNLAAEIMDLYGLAPSEVARRMAQAPQGVQYRHRLSWAARQFVAEPVTAAQDARDVLLVFSTWELRYRQPPFAPWVGLETSPTLLGAHLAAYRQLLGRVQARDALPWL